NWQSPDTCHCILSAVRWHLLLSVKYGIATPEGTSRSRTTILRKCTGMPVLLASFFTVAVLRFDELTTGSFVLVVSTTMIGSIITRTPRSAWADGRLLNRTVSI